MDEIVKVLATQVPDLVIITAIVLYGLKYIRERDQELQKQIQLWVQTTQRLEAVLDKNMLLMGALGEALEAAQRERTEKSC